MITELVNVHLSNVINNIKQIYMRRIMHGYNGKNNIIKKTVTQSFLWRNKYMRRIMHGYTGKNNIRKKQLLKAYYGGTNI